MSARTLETIEDCDLELDRIEDRALNAMRFHQSHKLAALEKLRAAVKERRIELQHGDFFQELCRKKEARP